MKNAIQMLFALVMAVGVCSAAEPPTKYYVNGDCGNNTWTGTSPICQAPDGPKRTIQAAVDATSNDDSVTIADGTYSGVGNTNVVFPPHSLSIASENGRANCIIDCQNVSRAFKIENNPSGSSSIRGLTIKSGVATEGGAIYIDDGLLFIWDCLITGCQAGKGGAIYGPGSDINASGCTFLGNSSNSAGGAIYIWDDLTLNGCNFISNSAVGSGGAVYNSGSLFGSIRNCNFNDNTSGELGGAACIVNATNMQITDSQFSGNEADVGGAVYNESSNSTVTGCGFFDNSATRFGGAFTNSGSAPTITDCDFGRNEAGQGGGAVAGSSKSAPKFDSCRFFENTSKDGGAMFGFQNSGSTVKNCEFVNNTATGSGGGIYNNDCTPTVSSSSFTGNQAAESSTQGGAIASDAGTTTRLYNSILWGNFPNEISDQSGAATLVSYSDIQGGWAGAGNIDADPLFVDPIGGDMHTIGGSPANDAGANAFVPAGTTQDLDGNPRFVDDPNAPDTGLAAGGPPEIVDMGAYEYQGDSCYADCDQSTGVGVLDVFDFLCFQNSFVSGETYACDCDTSTGLGVCDVFDFLCFQNAFVGGCP